jgi:hypothetical protein
MTSLSKLQEFVCHDVRTFFQPQHNKNPRKVDVIMEQVKELMD